MKTTNQEEVDRQTGGATQSEHFDHQQRIVEQDDPDDPSQQGKKEHADGNGSEEPARSHP